uniref:Uncharacterized protein n=1 Tax=Plectus sambesii TaxID=2011161 RepID=A0A914W3V4_9BILA
MDSRELFIVVCERKMGDRQLTTVKSRELSIVASGSCRSPTCLFPAAANEQPVLSLQAEFTGDTVDEEAKNCNKLAHISRIFKLDSDSEIIDLSIICSAITLS